MAAVNAADTMRRPCSAEGKVLNSDMSIIFGVGRCPDCGGLVTLDDNTGTIEGHTVLVIGDD